MNDFSRKKNETIKFLIHFTLITDHTVQNSQNKWTKISDLETNIFELKVGVKSGLQFFILKFTEPLQRYLLTCQANSAFLDRFVCTGQQQLSGRLLAGSGHYHSLSSYLLICAQPMRLKGFSVLLHFAAIHVAIQNVNKTKRQKKENVMLWFGRPRGIPNAVSKKEYQKDFFLVSPNNRI